MPINKKVTILGSGSAGLTAAIYAARANLEPLVIQGLQAGGQLTITTEVENFPGFPEGILGPTLMEEMHKQAERFGTQFIYDNAESVDLSKRPYVVRTSAEEIHTDRLLIRVEADGTRRVRMCNLRRLLLPRQARVRRGRRGYRDGGSDVPDTLRLASDGDPQA
jgi:thioredoxin reductase